MYSHCGTNVGKVYNLCNISADEPLRMGQAAEQVSVLLDALHQVRDSRRKAVALARLSPLETGPAVHADHHRPPRPSLVLDTHLVDTRILGIEKLCRLDEGRIGDIRHPVWESAGVVVVTHNTTYCNESPALRWALQPQHLCRYCLPSFQGRKPPYAGQSSIFLVKIHTAEKIDIYYSSVAMAKVATIPGNTNKKGRTEARPVAMSPFMAGALRKRLWRLYFRRHSSEPVSQIA